LGTKVEPEKWEYEEEQIVRVRVPLHRFWVSADAFGPACGLGLDDSFDVAKSGELQIRLEDDGETVYVSDGSHAGVVTLPYPEFRKKILSVLMPGKYGEKKCFKQRLLALREVFGN